MAYKKILLKSDNMAVLNITRLGYTKDMHLATDLRNTWLVTARFDIQLSAELQNPPDGS